MSSFEFVQFVLFSMVPIYCALLVAKLLYLLCFQRFMTLVGSGLRDVCVIPDSCVSAEQEIQGHKCSNSVGTSKLIKSGPPW